MTSRPCLELGCPNTVQRGRCPPCERAHRAVRDGRIYHDPRWAKTRARALKRASHRCQQLEAGRRCPVRSGLHGHHNYEGGVEQMLRNGADPFDERFVVMLCSPHHRRAERLLRAQRARIRPFRR